MENFLRNHGWAITLSLIALGATLSAVNVNAFVASLLAPYTVPSPPPAPTQERAKPTTSATARADRAGLLAQRCLFGCAPDANAPKVCDPACGDDQRCEDGQCVALTPSEAQEPMVALSPLNLKLVGVMVANRTQYSSALLIDNNTRESIIARIGDTIQEGAVLIDVWRDRVLIERSGQQEYIKMNDTITPNAPLPSAAARTPRAAVTPPPTAPKPTGPNAAAAAAVASDSAVQRGGPNTFEVRRDALNAALNNKAALATGATIVPNYSEGQRNGLKMVGVQPNSVYSQVGLQSGDVLQSVNGTQIKSQAHALELFEQLRNRDDINLQVERNGRKEKLSYKVK